MVTENHQDNVFSKVRGKSENFVIGQGNIKKLRKKSDFTNNGYDSLKKPILLGDNPCTEIHTYLLRGIALLGMNLLSLKSKPQLESDTCSIVTVKSIANFLVLK